MRARTAPALWLAALAGTVLGACAHAPGGGKKMEPGREFAVGADVSMLKALVDSGVTYRTNGRATDPVRAFRDAGYNQVRLRLFHSPDGTHGQVNDLAYTVALARTLTGAGFGFLLDFHYSDWWADPGQQRTPAAWVGLGVEGLAARVREYSRDCVRALAEAGAPPGMVQVGNEVTPGMLWPCGALGDGRGDCPGGGRTEAERWSAFARLLKAGIAGVREALPGTTIMIHVDCGGNAGAATWFFDNLRREGVEYDVIGLSYYPFWHGSLEDLAATLSALAERFGKPIHVVEIGYPHRTDSFYEKTIGENERFRGFVRDYPMTPEGQARFVDAVVSAVRATPRGLGAGVWYWAPEWIPPDGGGNATTARALFDYSGNALPGFFALGRASR